MRNIRRRFARILRLDINSPVNFIIKGVCIAVVVYVIYKLCIGIFIWFWLWSWSRGDEQVVTRDVRQYSAIISSLDVDDVAHFPQPIPDNAKNVRLYYEKPHFWYGGLFLLQLRMSLPKEDIQALRAKYQREAKQQYVTAPMDHQPTKELGPGGVVYDYEQHQEMSLIEQALSGDYPDAYVTYVLENTYETSENGSLIDVDHYGVSINESVSVIVYWISD